MYSQREHNFSKKRLWNCQNIALNFNCNTFQPARCQAYQSSTKVHQWTRKTRHKDMIDSFNPTNNINVTESTYFWVNPYDGEDRNKKEMV